MIWQKPLRESSLWSRVNLQALEITLMWAVNAKTVIIWSSKDLMVDPDLMVMC